MEISTFQIYLIQCFLLALKSQIRPTIYRGRSSIPTLLKNLKEQQQDSFIIKLKIFWLKEIMILWRSYSRDFLLNIHFLTKKENTNASKFYVLAR